MGLSGAVTSDSDRVLARNGYARLTDLDEPAVREILRAIEAYQVAFLGMTRKLWGPDFPIPGDALAHFSRQWEFPYAWANLPVPPGRALDAGSGITFFPFLLASKGYEVDCCDGDGDGLGLAGRFLEAAARTGCPVRFQTAELTDLPYPDGAFDAVTCISVLEHAGPKKLEILRALARVLRPGGRLILTCDVDLGEASDLPLEDLALILGEIEQHFELVYPLDLTRPSTMLTSDAFLASAPWRLPWPWRPPREFTVGQGATGSGHFRSIAILGITASRRST
jgi:SAM-dependent methyltransferase